MSGQDAILRWAKQLCQPYNILVENFTVSWKDGRAFCAVLDASEKGCLGCAVQSLDPQDAAHNLSLAFSTAEKLGIPSLLEPEDILDLDIPEPLSITTYLSTIFKRFRPPAGFSGGGYVDLARAREQAEAKLRQKNGIPPPQSNPSCGVCGKPIGGRCAEAIGLSFHVDCFRCCGCRKSLVSQTSCLNVGNKPYCESCGKAAFVADAKQRRESTQLRVADPVHSTPVSATPTKVAPVVSSSQTASVPEARPRSTSTSSPAQSASPAQNVSLAQSASSNSSRGPSTSTHLDNFSKAAAQSNHRPERTSNQPARPSAPSDGGRSANPFLAMDKARKDEEERRSREYERKYGLNSSSSSQSGAGDRSTSYTNTNSVSQESSAPVSTSRSATEKRPADNVHFNSNPYNNDSDSNVSASRSPRQNSGDRSQAAQIEKSTDAQEEKEDEYVSLAPLKRMESSVKIVEEVFMDVSVTPSGDDTAEGSSAHSGEVISSYEALAVTTEFDDEIEKLKKRREERRRQRELEREAEEKRMAEQAEERHRQREERRKELEAKAAQEEAEAERARAERRRQREALTQDTSSTGHGIPISPRPTVDTTASSVQSTSAEDAAEERRLRREARAKEAAEESARLEADMERRRKEREERRKQVEAELAELERQRVERDRARGKN